ALRAQLDMLIPTEFAMSKYAVLEDRVRLLEDVEAMLSEFRSMVSPHIDCMLITESQASLPPAASGAEPATLTRSSSHGRNKVELPYQPLVKPMPPYPPR
ncbi:MAG: hypothetical protein ACKPKO_46000, partial [Candidatus Fonsibacter sp.]